MLVKLDRATAEDVVERFEMAIRQMNETMCKTLTYDIGKEIDWHNKLAESNGLKIYFDPYGYWQPGNNESTNGLLLDFHPRGAD